MRIYIKKVLGCTTRTYDLDVEPSHSIDELRSTIQVKEGVHHDKKLCNLVFAGRPLEDGHKLSDYNVQNESTLYLVIRKPQRAPSQLLEIEKPSAAVEIEKPSAAGYQIVSRWRELQHFVNGFDLTIACDRVCRGDDIAEGDVIGLCDEFKKFMVMKGLELDFDDEIFSPSSIVDEFWKACIVQSKLYAKFCAGLGGFIHREDGREDRGDHFAATMTAYRNLYELDPPARFWQEPSLKRKSSPVKNQQLEQQQQKHRRASSSSSSSSPATSPATTSSSSSAATSPASSPASSSSSPTNMVLLSSSNSMELKCIDYINYKALCRFKSKNFKCSTKSSVITRSWKLQGEQANDFLDGRLYVLTKEYIEGIEHGQRPVFGKNCDLSAEWKRRRSSGEARHELRRAPELKCTD